LKATLRALAGIHSDVRVSLFDQNKVFCSKPFMKLRIIELQHNIRMAPAYPLKRCMHCGRPLAETAAPGGEHGSRGARCVDCDRIDPLLLPANKAWIEGELRPPS
jgi:hypothetical protein